MIIIIIIVIIIKMSLLQTIKKDPGIRRLFGERELKIIEKHLMGVRLKPSETIRLSRDIRKKFNAIQELAEFSDEFKLKKGAYIKEMIKEAEEIIHESKEFYRIKKIVLFGSAAENELTLSSDIDLAVEFSSINESDALLFRRSIMSKVNDRIDIQVYNVLPDKIKMEIDKNGKILYERKDK